MRWGAGVLLVVLAGCTAAPPGPAAPRSPALPRSPATSVPASVPPVPPAVPRVAWQDCTRQTLARFPERAAVMHRFTFSCGTLPVPLDHGTPHGAALQLYLVRARLTGAHPTASLVVNPGGPGGSGADWAALLPPALRPELLSRFDLVGFDPRGAGRSAPIRCIPRQDDAPDPPADPLSGAGYAAQAAAAARAARACARRYGDRLGHFDTTDTARDMDLLRQALGEQKLTYLGYSYGTLLGAVYATLFPDRVGAMVLDGPVDPTATDEQAAQAQAAAFEDAFDRFAADCVRRHCPLGAGPRGFVTRLIAKATAHPVPAPGSRRRADGGTVLEAVLAALYGRSGWPRLARALADADRGNAAGVLAFTDAYDGRHRDGSYDNIDDAERTIGCADSTERPTDATIRHLLADWRRRYPLFGALHAIGLLACRGWAVSPHPVPRIHTRTGQPILVVATRHDPATPYASAQRLIDALGNARLLTWDGDGHTAYPLTYCVDVAVDSYLAGNPPAPDTTCPAG